MSARLWCPHLLLELPTLCYFMGFPLGAIPLFLSPTKALWVHPGLFFNQCPKIGGGSWDHWISEMWLGLIGRADVWGWKIGKNKEEDLSVQMEGTLEQ
jgi:hypothetical protein